MVYSYYPGCTLKNKAKDLDTYARRSAEALGFTLEEIPEWQCCGGVYPMAKNETAHKLPSVRALVHSRDENKPLVTLCSACFNVIKQVNYDIRTDEDIRRQANNYMQLDVPYGGEADVLHYLEVLRNRIGFEEIKKKVVHPFTGKKIGAYYGCLLLRPGKIMDFDNTENPTIIEDFIRAIGGTPVIYAMRNECCGGYISLEAPDIAAKKSNNVAQNARDNGAEMLITACPLCFYNIKKQASQVLPIMYFTELLAEALGVKEGGAQ